MKKLPVKLTFAGRNTKAPMRSRPTYRTVYAQMYRKGNWLYFYPKPSIETSISEYIEWVSCSVTTESGEHVHKFFDSVRAGIQPPLQVWHYDLNLEIPIWFTYFEDSLWEKIKKLFLRSKE